tara:strand:- start:315 stop:1106 length:792 start_codon:yes stop_codon:yes gene_type:complete
MKYHLSNGCSFSTKKTYLSCHQKLGQLMDIPEPTINLAKGGRGNDRILNTTMHWFYKNPERMKDTFVSIGWTTGYRWDYVSSARTPKEKKGGIKGELLKFDYQWGTWQLPHHDFFMRDKDFDVELASAVKLYTNILGLQYFLKYHNIPYVFYHALTNDLPETEVNGKPRPDLKLLKDQIDKTHFYNFESSQFAKQNVQMQLDNRSTAEHKVYVPNKDYVQSHFEFCAKNGWTKSHNDGHPNQVGHHKWAENLFAFVKANNLIS